MVQRDDFWCATCVHAPGADTWLIHCHVGCEIERHFVWDHCVMQMQVQVGRCILVDLPDLAVSSTYHP